SARKRFPKENAGQLKKGRSRNGVFAPPLRGSSICVVAILCTSCTDAKLEPIPKPLVSRDDKLAVSGSFCTTKPEDRVFPLRVLFVVDSSTSMQLTGPPDPTTGETGREKGVRETWQRLLANDPQATRIGILRFSAAAGSRTSVDTNGDGVADSFYTNDPVLLAAGTKALAITDRTTNYLNALSEAFFEMRTELKAATLESLPLSKYAIVFVSDGLPDADNEDERKNTRDVILAGVRQLVELANQFHVGQFQFHTAFLSAGTGDPAEDQAQQLLQAMATAGEGNFRSFAAG